MKNYAVFFYFILLLSCHKSTTFSILVQNENGESIKDVKYKYIISGRDTSRSGYSDDKGLIEGFCHTAGPTVRNLVIEIEKEGYEKISKEYSCDSKNNIVILNKI